MNRPTPTAARPVFVEALEPRIAPAGLIESKFTSVTVGNAILLDASGGANDYQGLSTAFGGFAGSYLLYLNAGKAVVYTTDLNGDGILDPGEITGIAVANDSQGRAPNLTLFSDVHGDIVTNLLPGHFISNLTDLDNNPNNGRDGRVLLDNPIGQITLRTLTAADIDSTVPGNTLANRLALTHFSVYGNIIAGGDFSGLSIDTRGSGDIAAKFGAGGNVYTFSGAVPVVNGIMTGSAASNQYYHFTQRSPQVLTGANNGAAELVNNNIEGMIRPFTPPAGEHGGDISSIAGINSGTIFSLGVIASGSGGTGARGGNISNVTMHGAVGSYSILAGDGGTGPTGGAGGSIINFSDITTQTGQALIHTGNGGRGTLGNGGVGGTATFGETSIAADVQVALGNGGDGFTRGGDGSSLTNVLFTTPDVTIPIGGRFIGTWHDIGDVGNTTPVDSGVGTGVATYSPHAIDFDGDGFGDAIFTTTNPDQVVIVFGDQTGIGFIQDNKGNFLSDVAQKTIVLKTPGSSLPSVTVGDFNGDGKPDIAVGSNNLNNFGGVDVYLNQTGNQVLNPVNAFNYTHNPLGDKPFSVAQHTAVPLLTNFGFYGGSGAILSLSSGDYNGDGIADIAYSERVVNILAGPGQIVGILFGEQATTLNTDAALVGAHAATVFVNGSADNGLINNTTNRPQGTGYFYANPGVFGSTNSKLQFDFYTNTSASYVRSTSVTNGNVPTPVVPGGPSLPTAPEYVISGIQNVDRVGVYSSLAPDPITHIPAAAGVTAFSFPLGQVDTNRNLSGLIIQITNQTPIIQDFTIVDGDQDGRPDLVFMYNVPQTYLDAYRGVGDGSYVRASTGVGGGDDNAGIFLGNFPNVPPVAVAVTSSDPTRSGRFDGFALENLLVNPARSSVRELRLIPGPITNDLYGWDTNVTTIHTYGTDVGAIDRQVNTLDAFYPTAPTAANPFPRANYGALATNVSNIDNGVILSLVGLDPIFGIEVVFDKRYLTENGFRLFSGNGGNSSNGAGGNAGALGDGTLNAGGTTLTTTSSIAIRYTAAREYAGSSLLQGGAGGNGFTTGGAGGSIAGVTARYTQETGVRGISLTSFLAGDGGDALSGNGGDGGSLQKLSIENGPAFLSGNGGSGFRGGNGGAILGNETIFDTSNRGVALLTGTGGQGSLNGGTGGVISRWSSLIEDFGGSVNYATGDGGSAAGGTGGAGGGILDSPLDVTRDRLNGALSLASGAGGNGLAGGAGGLIRNFLNQSTEQAAVPISLTVLAGNGGVGVSSVGGAGGSITAVQSNATGLGNGLVRLIAGKGGDSYGATGGAGGNLTDVNSTAISSPLVAAAGAGGDGLTVGGAGGSISSSAAGNSIVLDSAAQIIGKLLVVAGKGGDAYSALRQDILLPGDIDVNNLAHALLAFGGTSGQGGDGGSVSNVRQPVGTQTAVDVIAGNGGSTINANNAQTPTTGVGRGGSVSNVFVAGTLGSISRNTNLGPLANPPIKSYAATIDLAGNTTSTLNEFINFLTGDLLQPDGITPFSLTDAIGNVGMLAGASGNVSGGQPARDGANGSVINVLASSIMSIVAGSVDRVAPLAEISGVAVTNPDGVLGADKSVNSPFGPNGRLDYYDLNGVDQPTLQPGYRLIDGAIYAERVTQTPGQIIIGPRVNPGR